MIEISEGEYSQWFTEVENTIRSSSFIAVDLEFLGLPSSYKSNAISLFDTAEERYSKLCESVKKFPPCQLGFACFKEMDDRYEVDVFCIYLFKRLCKRVFSFSLSAMTFLSHHNFDFNKLIQDGVTYLNNEEYNKIKSDLLNNTFDYDILTDKLESRIQMLKMRVLLETTVEEDDTNITEKKLPYAEERVRLPHPMLINLCLRESTSDDEVDHWMTENYATLWNSPLTALEAAAVVYALSHEFPTFDFQLDASRTLLYIAEIPLIFRNSCDKRRQKANLKTLLNELLGVSRIFKCISECKKPLIGHNSLLDFMYIYNCFEADLPESYKTWKAALVNIFPLIIDTKILSVGVQDILSSQGVQDLSLETLGNYVDSPSCGAVLPFDYPEVILGKHMRSSFKSGDLYHNAGYDALMTGKVFLKIAHLYAFTKCTSSGSNKMPWSFGKILIVLKARVANRLPVPLIDHQYCNLMEEDPPGQRPDIIRVKKRTNIKWLDWVIELPSFSIISTFLNPFICTTISTEECVRLQDDLSRVFGSFRVEVKSNGSDLLLATNTAKSFARVGSFFACHEDFYLIEDMRNTSGAYEKRLTSCREKKNRLLIKKTKSSSLLPLWFSGVAILSVVICFKFFKSGK